MANDLCIYKKICLSALESQKYKFKLIARLLDFEEKWENKFQCVVQPWTGFMGGSRHVAFTFDIACYQKEQVRSSMH